MAKKIKNENEKNDGNTKALPSMENVTQLHFFKPPVPLTDLQKYKSELESILRKTELELGDVDFFMMTDAQRRRLLGSGIRRLGFIVKTGEMIQNFPEFKPSFVDEENFENLVTEILETRAITVTLEQQLRIYTDVLLLAGDEAYKLSLMYYASVRDAARRGVPGAQAIFRVLQAFFRRGKRTGEEPTIPELERDVHALLQHRKDGKIVIEGAAKHTTAGELEIVDETAKPKGAFKETVQGTVCTQCGAENVDHARFCIQCGKQLIN